MPEAITQNLDLWTAALLKQSSAGNNGSGNNQSYGVQKLRELILELALRGKLVPQDPNDEPASVLLERLQKGRTQLTRQGQNKQQRLTPEIATSEKPYSLPAGWCWARLPDIASYKVGKTPSTKNPDFWAESEIGIPWVSISDMDHMNVLTTTTKRITDYAAERVFGYEPIPEGSLLMSFKLTVGKTAILGINAYHNEAIISLQPGSGIAIDYLLRALPLRAQQGNTKRALMGQTLNSTSLALLLIPVPPTAEQRRIVAKVDELMALCVQLEHQQTDSIEAHQTLVETLLGALTSTSSQQERTKSWTRMANYFDTLFTTEHSIDQLKQTILQLAIMGRLVPQEPYDEPASALLARVAEAKHRLVEAGEIPQQKPLAAIDPDAMPFRLPDGWRWAYVSDVAKMITSGSRDWAKYYSTAGALFLTMGNLSRGDYQLRLDSLRFVNPPRDGEGSRTRLEANDLLISITGDVGNLGLIPDDFPEAYINQHTCLLRFMPDCQNRYFAELMRSPWAKYQFDAPQRGVKNSFRLGDVGEMIIPIPPLAEQRRIVARIDEVMALCDNLKARLTSARNTQIHLAEAIVAQGVA